MQQDPPKRWRNTTWRHNPEDLDLNLHRRENLKFRTHIQDVLK